MDFFVSIDQKKHPVEVNRKSMKRVRLKVFPSGAIKLSVPLDTSDEWISGFLASKEGWIAEKSALFQTTKAVEKEEHICSGTATRILGRQLTILVLSSAGKRIEQQDDMLVVFTSETEQDKIDRQYRSWWHRKAKSQYTQTMARLYPIVGKHGITRPDIIVKQMQTLWGSCGKNNGRINLNYYLLKAPQPCIEYVILHELTHFLYPHHNEDFYTFMTVHMPDWQERKRLLDYETVLGI